MKTKFLKVIDVAVQDSIVVTLSSSTNCAGKSSYGAVIYNPESGASNLQGFSEVLDSEQILIYSVYAALASIVDASHISIYTAKNIVETAYGKYDDKANSALYALIREVCKKHSSLYFGLPTDKSSTVEAKRLAQKASTCIDDELPPEISNRQYNKSS